MTRELSLRVVTVVGAALTLSACGSNPVGPVPERLLNEAWEWQSACCGIAGDSRTPATEGFHYVLRFYPRGIVRAERDGTVVQETTFRVRRVSPIDFAYEFTEITYGEPLVLAPGIEPVSRHMLVLTAEGILSLKSLDGCNDCFGDWVFLPGLESAGREIERRY
jgi:hypothetical protein